MKKHKGSRGAVSVFLSLILVPCIVASCLFVDVGRVHLSKASADSSADLALNTLLTNYDGDLKEWYGMVASCQNIDDFYDVSAQYFLRALSSRDLSDDEILLLSDKYAHVTQDDSIYDLLKVEPKSGVKISAVKDANLSNAALIKDQIVDFMKFRAPIEITSTIIEHIKRDHSVGGIVDADVNKPLVDDKQKFYENDGKLTEAAYFTWLALQNFRQNLKNNSIDNAQLDSCYKIFAEYPPVIKEILFKSVVYFSNTTGLTIYNPFLCKIDEYDLFYSDPTRNFSEVYDEKKKNPDTDEFEFSIDVTKIQTLVQNLGKTIEDFNSARSGYADAASVLMGQLPPEKSNAMQWWVRMDQTVNKNHSVTVTDPKDSSKALTYTHHGYFEKTAQEMLRAYSKVKAIDKCQHITGTAPEEWGGATNWKQALNVEALLQQVVDLQTRYLTNVSNAKAAEDPYLHAAYKLKSISAAQNGNLNPDNHTVQFKGDTTPVSVSAAIGIIYDTLNEERGYMTEAIEKLDLAINGDKTKDPPGNTPALDDLVQLAEDYKTSLDKWKETADNTDTDMGKDDVVEIVGEEGNPKKPGLKEALKIDKRSVEILKKRLENIRSQLQAMVDAIDSYKIGTTCLKDIATVSDLVSAAQIDDSRIGLTEQELQTYAYELFDQKFAPKDPPQMEHASDDDYNLTIDPVTKNVKTPELYIALHEKYNGMESAQTEVEKAKKENDDAAKKGDEEAKKAKNKSRYHGNGKDVPKDFSTGFIEADNVLMNLIGFVKNIVSGDLTEMRDDLYATTYVMKMFSHATYQNEGLYHLLSEDQQKELNLKNYNTDPVYYKSVMGTDPKTKDKVWISESPSNYYNKSLTNKMINLSHNPAYEAEIEYILHGNSNPDPKKGSGADGNIDNVKKVYSEIYEIRYSLNLVSGFQNFWAITSAQANSKGMTAGSLFGAARMVQLATKGVISIPVTEAILIPLLTVYETSMDLDRLEAGFPVEAYKSKEGQWWLALPEKLDSVSKVVKAITSDKRGHPNPGDGLFYSDYLTILVYLGLTGPGRDSMYQRISEVIQYNMGTMLKKNGTYSLENSRMYFNLDVELRVKPLMITIPYFKLEEYDNHLLEKTDWCTYKLNTVRGYP